jgi:hypothetical protein
MFPWRKKPNRFRSVESNGPLKTFLILRNESFIPCE